jgi:hypothetical protein
MIIFNKVSAYEFCLQYKDILINNNSLLITQICYDLKIRKIRINQTRDYAIRD